MKKIIVPFEGPNYPEQCLGLVRELNAISPVRLTAVFAPEVDYSQIWAITGGMAGATYLPDLGDEDRIVAETSQRLEGFCREHAIEVFIHKERLDFALAIIRKETRFADLLVLDGRHFFENIDARQPNAYMKEILHTTECPILLVPEKIEMPGSIILAYDGSAASVHAIREFSHLFPEFSGLPATLVYLGGSKDATFPDRENIEELVSCYFTEVRLLQLHMDHKDFFSRWLPAQERSWLVTGSYGRSDLSLLFSKSFISSLIGEHRIPVFMAHR
jgi:hypothetical protein